MKIRQSLRAKDQLQNQVKMNLDLTKSDILLSLSRMMEDVDVQVRVARVYVRNVANVMSDWASIASINITQSEYSNPFGLLIVFIDLNRSF